MRGNRGGLKKQAEELFERKKKGQKEKKKRSNLQGHAQQNYRKTRAGSKKPQ